MRPQQAVRRGRRCIRARREYARSIRIESAMYHRLTANNTSIEGGVASRAVDGGNNLLDKRRVEDRGDREDYPSQKLHGFWVRNSSFTQRNNETDQTMYTRYEELECLQTDDDAVIILRQLLNDLILTDLVGR
jgi:hypothetical protein